MKDGSKFLRLVYTTALVSGVFFFVVGCKLLDRDANYISKKEVWQKISREAPKHGLERLLCMRSVMRKVV